ncbi:MAG: hypothetical protein ACFCU8_17360 [Thermosynechococcaceae cyanobacterium]
MGALSTLLNPTLLLQDLQRINKIVQQISGCLIDKRQECAQRGITEYWIVDPIAAVFLVLTLDK